MHDQEILIVATLERHDDAGKLHTVSVLELRRKWIAHDLASELDRLWRIVRGRAEHQRWIATLRLTSADRSRSVSLRFPPFVLGEIPERERATTILEALRKLTHG